MTGKRTTHSGAQQRKRTPHSGNRAASGAHAAHTSASNVGMGRGSAARVGRRGTAPPLLDLLAQDTAMAGGGEFFAAVLEVVGAEHLHLGARLALWQREQDRLLNRAWRRPGGLVRPAGL